MIGTVLQQGVITSTGNDYTIKLVSGVDFLNVYNWTTTNAGIVASTGIEWYWQKNMPTNDGIVKGWSAGGANPYLVATLSGLGCGGFTLVDSSTAQLGANIVVTAGTNATQPVYDTGTTAGLSVGSIVRVYNTAQTNLNGLDFSIDTIVPATSFRLANALATAPGAIAGAGTYRLVAANVDEYNKFYPSRRIVSNITQANPAVVTTLVDHSLTTGQSVRFTIYDSAGMTQLSGQLVTVTVINASTFSINVDTTGYTAFRFPVIGDVAFTPPEVVPVGIAMAYNTSITAALKNNEFTGIRLSSANAGGLHWAPAGAVGDEIYWVAGNSSN